jgi:hypothetical protein
LWWEAGYAQGRGKPVYVIGPRVNIFCEHPDVSHFKDFEAFLQEVREAYFDAQPPVTPHSPCIGCAAAPCGHEDACRREVAWRASLEAVALSPEPAAVTEPNRLVAVEVSTDPKLAELLAGVRTIPVTPEMRSAQVRSFAYANVALSNPAVTRELIDREADKLQLGREA